MKRSIINPSVGCAVWRERVPHLLGLPDDDPGRIAWKSHAGDCPDCRRALAEEADFWGLLGRLPEPGPARVVSTVMQRVRQPRGIAALFRPRELVWGLAGSFAGVVIGILIAGALPPDVNRGEPAAGYETVLTEMEDDMEQLMWEFTSTEQQEAR